MEVVLRNEQVEQARAGDKLVFTGNLVVVPDIAMLTIPGERVQVGRRGARSPGSELRQRIGSGTTSSSSPFWASACRSGALQAS